MHELNLHMVSSLVVYRIHLHAETFYVDLEN